MYMFRKQMNSREKTRLQKNPSSKFFHFDKISSQPYSIFKAAYCFKKKLFGYERQERA